MLRRSRLIEVGDAGQLLPDLDLRALARHLAAPEQGQHSPAPAAAVPRQAGPTEPAAALASGQPLAAR